MNLAPDPSLWPLTLDEAVERLLKRMNDDEKEKLQRLSEDELRHFHFGWGMDIRFEFGLWRGNEHLLASCGDPHPDDASMVIVRSIWRKLNRLPFDVASMTLAEMDEHRRQVKLGQDRWFYDRLGQESTVDTCKREGCGRGKVRLSVFCRSHHFEMIHGYPCPFQD